MNKDTYESKDVVDYFSIYSGLQEPEKLVMDELKPKLPKMRMLDIGVGCGRTTAFFSPLVKEYVGIDYSANMIDICRERYPTANARIKLMVCDARSMDVFEKDYFDFILFSYNGLDSVEHEDRLLILSEVMRVGRSGGLFCFSSHNLQSVDTLYRIRPTLHPYYMVHSLLFALRIRCMNGRAKELKAKKFAVVNDGAHSFGLKNYYIKPGVQISQLEKQGFKDIRLFPLQIDGKMKRYRKIEEILEPWIYYFCRIRSV